MGHFDSDPNFDDVPSWIVELLQDWSTLDISPRPVGDEMRALVEALDRMRMHEFERWMAIHREFRPWVWRGPADPHQLKPGLRQLAALLDEELGD